MKSFFSKVNYILGNKKNNFYKCIVIYSSSSLLDLVVLSMLPILISLLTGVEIKEKFFFDKESSIYNIGSVILLITIFKAYVNYKSIYKIVSYTSLILKINREKIFSFYKNVFLNDFSSGKFEKFLNTSSYVVGVFSENILFKLITVISEILIIIIICSYLAWINIYLLMGLFFFFFSLLSVYFLLIKKLISVAGVEQSNALEKLTEIIHNVFKGLKEIKVLNLTDFFDKKFNFYNEKYQRNFISYQKIIFLPKYLLESVMISFVILLFFFISFFLKNSLNFYLELIGVFLFAAFRITPLAYSIFSSLSQIYGAKYALDNIYEELIKIDDYKNKFRKINNLNIQHIFDNFQSISFEKVYFKYSNNENKFILNDINFFIKKGECIGIIGDSGSGKTTLVNILLGLLHPTQGKLYLNKNIDAYSTDIFKKMSYTPQDFFLVNGNIIENITLGVDINKIDEDKVFEVLKITGLDKSLQICKENFIKILSSRKVDTLSGGQSQRIAICRNFYFDREINVFDEFTSSLDIATENKIIEFLNTLKGNNTTIIISHRINALKYCDKIYEIKNGYFIEKKFS